MAAKKTTDMGNLLMSAATFLRESVTGGIQSAFNLLEEGTLSLFRRLFRCFAFFFFSLLAAVFLLFGLAKFLNELYQRPGLGEIVVGTLILSGVLFLYMIDRYHNNQP